MKAKKLAAMLIAGIMVFSVAGCGAATVEGEAPAAKETEQAAPAEQPAAEAAEETAEEQTTGGSVGLSVSTLNNPFFVTLVEGAQAAADAQGIDLIVVDAGDDSAKQASDIEDLQEYQRIDR